MIGSLIRGIRLATVNWKMLLLLLAGNILMALPVAIPLVALILQTTSGTAVADSMMGDKLDIDWVTDLINLQMPGFSLDSAGIQTALMLVVSAGTYLLLSAFFSGGMITVFASESGRFSVREFWAGCGEHFWRFVRLILISLVFYGAVIGVYIVIHRQIGRIDEAATAYEDVVYKRWMGLAALMLMVLAVNMIFDYARIMTVISGSRKMIRQTAAALWFVVRHPLSSSSLYLGLVLIGLGLFALLVRLRAALDEPAWSSVFLTFAVGQSAIASRIWSRMSLYAGQIDLYLCKSPPVEVSEQMVEEPADPPAEAAAVIDQTVTEDM